METIKIVCILTSLTALTSARHRSSESSVAHDYESIYGEPKQTFDEPSLPESVTLAGDNQNSSENEHGSQEALKLYDEALQYRHNDPRNTLLWRTQQTTEENCACYKSAPGKPVSEKLNPKGDDLQRVVIYLYSKKSNPKVHLYIPNLEKQYDIPDLPFDDRDLLKPVDTDFLLKFLVDSPYSVTKKVFKTRPDHRSKRVEQPNAHEFKTIFSQILMAMNQQNSNEFIANIIKSALPEKSKENILKFLHSLGYTWDLQPDALKNINNKPGEISDYEVHTHPDLFSPTNEQQFTESSPHKHHSRPVYDDQVLYDEKSREDFQPVASQNPEHPKNYPDYPKGISFPTQLPIFDKQRPSLYPEYIDEFPKRKPFPDQSVRFPTLDETGMYPHKGYPSDAEPSKTTLLPTYDERMPTIHPEYRGIDGLPKDESFPDQSVRFPILDEARIFPHEGYPSDAEPSRTTRLPTFDVQDPSLHQEPSVSLRPTFEPFRREDVEYPYQSENNLYPQTYGEVEHSSNPHHYKLNNPQDDYKLNNPQDVNYPQYEQYEDGRHPKKFKYTTDLKVSPTWTSSNGPKTNLFSNKTLTKLPQPQGLSWLINYLKQRRNNSYTENHDVVQQPGQFDINALLKSLNPEFSYNTYGRSQPETLTPDPTFDKWFEGQIGDLGTEFAEMNADSIKLVIERILRDNNLAFTKDGLLVNKFGNAVSVGELRLRPIMIGNSVDVGIKTLLNGALDEKIKLAHQTPYLHGLLVSFGTPPQVLGLIPLGYRAPQTALPVSSQLYKFDGTLSNPDSISDVFGSSAQGVKLPNYNKIRGGNTFGGKGKIYSWISPTHTVKYRPQIVRKTFNNVPLDKDGFRKFLARLKQTGFGDNFELKNEVLPIYDSNKALGLERNVNWDQKFDTAYPTVVPLDEKFDEGFEDEHPAVYSSRKWLNPRQVSIETTGKFDTVYPTGTTGDNESSDLDWLYSKRQPPHRHHKSGSKTSLSFNGGLPHLYANGNLDVNMPGIKTELDSQFNRMDLSKLRGILKALPSVVTPDDQAVGSDAVELNNAANLLLSRTSGLAFPTAQVNSVMGGYLKGSLDGLLPSSGTAKATLEGPEVKVPAGVGKDFEFTKYPVEPEHAAADTPEYRIIGGNAATGSGTPLSNKGKSGVIV